MPSDDRASATNKDSAVIGRRGWPLGLAIFIGEMVLALSPMRDGGSPSVFWLLIAAGTGVGLVAHYRTVVRLETDAMAVVSPRRTRRYAWEDILETSWERGSGFLGAWSGPVLRLRGGPWDEPGPNLPSRVASLVLLGKKANREAADRLADAAAQHGVTFTPDLVRLINTGRRRPQLPGDTS